MEMCGWCNLSEKEKRWLVADTEYWSIYLADEQDYIGRCLVMLKRHCGSLSELQMPEWIELKQVVDELERCLKTVLGTELCNWSCLMNSFYKEDVPNPHLHLHVRPRYKKPVILNGNVYADAEYGHHYKLSKGVFIPEEDMEQLLHLLKSNLHFSAKACREFEEKGIC